MISRLSLAVVGGFLLFGAAGSAHAALQSNSHGVNALTTNALTLNGHGVNGASSSAFLSAGTAIGDLNGVSVQTVNVPEVRR